MDKFRQISTELWLLIDVINCFSLSIFVISLPIFFKLCMKMSSFKIEKIPWRGMLHACSAFILCSNYVLSVLKSTLLLCFTFIVFLLCSCYTPDRRQSKTLLTIDERRSKITSNSVFDAEKWEMAIKKSVYKKFWSLFVESIYVLRLPPIMCALVFCVSSSRCLGLIYGLWLWNFLVNPILWPWLFGVFSSRCLGLICGLRLWHFLVIPVAWP